MSLFAEAVGRGSDRMELANRLHKQLCDAHNTQLCQWDEEDWFGPTRQRYVRAADKILTVLSGRPDPKYGSWSYLKKAKKIAKVIGKLLRNE